MSFKNYLEPEDDKGYYSLNSLAYYYDKMAEKEKLIKELSDKVKGYNQTMIEMIAGNEETLEQLSDLWDDKMETFDDGVKDLLSQWVDDGTITHVIDTTLLDKKADKKEVEQVDQELVKVSQEITNTNKKVAEVEDRSIRPVFNAPSKEIIVSFMDDDGHPRVMSHLKPLFDSEGVPANVCLITSQFGNANSISVSDAKKLKSEGWTVASHTHNHTDLTASTRNTAEQEIGKASEVLKQHGLDHDILVYPYGGFNPTVIEVVRKYNKMAISTSEGFNLPPFNTFQMNRISGIGEAGVTVDSLKSVIDNAPEGSWIIFKTHTGYTAYENQSTFDDLRTIIQYVKSKGFPVVNIKEGMKRKGNILDVGGVFKNFRVGVDGNVRISTTFEDYSFTNATPISYFPYGESVTYFNNSMISGKGFPAGNNGGTVKTVRIRMDRYASEDASYQTFQPYYDNSMYRRRWIVNTSSWGPWEKVVDTANPFTINQTINAFTGNTPLNDFPAYKVTGFTATEGTPNGINGSFLTYRLRAPGYDYQTFKEYNTNRMYIRHSAIGGTWNEWKEIAYI